MYLGGEKNRNLQEVSASADSGKPGEQAALSFEAVEKEYDGFCLGPLTCGIPAGCVTGLVGENGAGKTTLMKLALGMTAPDRGTARCLGLDPLKEGKKARKDVGVVFGDFQLPGNFTAQMAGDFWQRVYEEFDSPYFKQLQERFAIPGNKPIRQFSAGMKAKLALAGAVSHHPRLLILDEPLNGLDPLAKEEAMEILRELSGEEISILISSHTVGDLERLADYLAFLHSGRLFLFEEKDRLLERYRAVQGTEEAMRRLREQNARLIGMRQGAFGSWAVLDRTTVQNREVLARLGILEEPASLEEIVTCLMREERAGSGEVQRRRQQDERTLL